LSRVRLSELARGYQIDPDDLDPEITGVTEDSRKVTPGTLFVAVRGTSDDGARYVEEALARGAVAVAGDVASAPAGVPVVRGAAARLVLSDLAARYFGHPARELQVIGFTGTFGKTSTSDVLQQLLSAGGARAGVLGSLGAKYGTFHDSSNGLTTPAPVELQRALRALRAAGADTIIMEVTSHALRLGRVEGLLFGGGLLAAIMPGEHTDFHRSYEDYIDAKRLFLNYLSPAATLAYDSDNHAARVLAAEARVARRSGFSLHGVDADLSLRNIALDHRGARFSIGRARLSTPLLGSGHLKNVALALAYGIPAGISIATARVVLRQLRPLRRRMERYEVDGRLVLDDTAGHPDSLQATFDVAAMLRRAPEMPGRRVVVVYALRGSRGVDINRRNARVLADLAAEHGVASLVVTAAADVAGPPDTATSDEIEASRETFASRGRPVEWHDDLQKATRAALRLTKSGDLIVLVGAQGMNEGKALLSSLETSRRTGSTYRN
jgi:UDP-N-acetylmuramoyl-L-alanyl-D-glutamate--2,6-diaminopimelate ligase